MMSMAKRVFVGGVLALACRGLWAQERLVGARDTQPAKATLAIVGGTLIDGHEGQPQSHAVVLVDGNRVAAVGTRDTLRVPPGTQIVDAAGMTVMPGLIDAHVHLDLLGHGDYARWHRLYTPRYTEIIATAARLAIMSGVTTVVDMFGPPDPLLAVRQKVDRGEIPGPRMKLSLGAILNSERGYVGRESYSWQVKTAEDARVTTQKLIGMGADIINAMDGLTADQIRAIAAEARKAGVKVTGIASSPQDLIMRIKAGQQALDHLNGLNGAASSLDGESLQVLFDARASVVPTLVQSTMIQLRASETPEYFVNNRKMALWTPPEIWQEIRGSLEHPERLPYFGQGLKAREGLEAEARFRQLWNSGVRVRIGTDTGSTANLPTEAMWQEMETWVQFGAPPMEVIAAATRRNAEWLNMGDQLGTISPGRLADIIIVDGNPLRSMRELRHVVTVIKDGKVVKSPEAAAAAASRSPIRP